MYNNMFRPKVIRGELCFFRPCAKLPSLQDRETQRSETHHVVISADIALWRQRNANFNLNKPCVMCLTVLLSRLLQSGSEPGLSLSSYNPPFLWVGVWVCVCVCVFALSLVVFQMEWWEICVLWGGEAGPRPCFPLFMWGRTRHSVYRFQWHESGRRN